MTDDQPDDPQSDMERLKTELADKEREIEELKRESSRTKNVGDALWSHEIFLKARNKLFAGVGFVVAVFGAFGYVSFDELYERGVKFVDGEMKTQIAHRITKDADDMVEQAKMDMDKQISDSLRELIAAKKEEIGRQMAVAQQSVAATLTQSLLEAKGQVTDLVKKTEQDIKVKIGEMEKAIEMDADAASQRVKQMRIAMLPQAGANLNGAILSRADLSGADLTRADLSNANLWSAILRRVDLSHANLNGADLRAADLTRADLSGADLNRVTTRDTSLCGVDLSQVQNLETVHHQGPSHLGVDTLYASGGKIPEVFLHGCGVPQELIEYLPSLFGAASPIQFYPYFISYSHNDEEFAQRLRSRMQQEKLRVWFARKEMRGGQQLHEQIDDALRPYEKLVLVLSESSMRCNWVRREIRNTRRRELEEGRQLLFPIAIIDFDRIEEWESFYPYLGEELAEEIRENFIPDLSNWKDRDTFEAGFVKLLNDLKAAS